MGKPYYSNQIKLIKSLMKSLKLKNSICYFQFQMKRIFNSIYNLQKNNV